MEQHKASELRKIEENSLMKIRGLNHEILTLFINNDSYPLNLQSVGKTNPDSKYSIFRQKSSIYVLEYVLSGKGYVHRNNVEYHVKQGDVYLLHKDEQHYYYADKKDPFSKIWINFDSEILTNIIDKLNLKEHTVFHLPDAKADFDNLFHLASISFYTSEVCYDMLATVSKILFAIKRQLSLSAHENSIEEDARSIISNATYGRITVNDVANKLHVTRQHLNRVFVLAYGITPYQYLINCKLVVAKSLLSSTSLSVTQISQLLGFYNDAHFSLLFKKKVGLSPTKYRQSVTSTAKTPPQ